METEKRDPETGKEMDKVTLEGDPELETELHTPKPHFSYLPKGCNQGLEEFRCGKGHPLMETCKCEEAIPLVK